jgi:hypothetical protein
MTQTTSTIEKKRKALLILPLLVLPFLFIAFFCLGGGGAKMGDKDMPRKMGFNMELPKVLFDRKDSSRTKLDFYKKADEDSIRKRAYRQQDPYASTILSTMRKTPKPMGSGRFVATPWPREDPKADEVLAKLGQLKGALQKSPASLPHSPLSDGRVTRNIPPVGYVPGMRAEPFIPPLRRPDTVVNDPALDRINKMLDKVIRIQQGAAVQPEAAVTEKMDGMPIRESEQPGRREVIETAVEAIPASVEEDQTLVTGASIALRLTETIRVGGVTIPRNQLVYGLVSINNDRMQVGINSIRKDRMIYTTALQVYDMDGLPGIHIPDMLTRNVAKQSADQGISSLNLSTYNSSLGAQAASAGVQAAKSLFSRKVRLVRVSVQAGYQVLLRNTKSSGAAMVVGVPTVDTVVRNLPDTGKAAIGDSTAARGKDSLLQSRRCELPAFPAEALTPFLHRSVREGKVTLTLQGLYLRGGLLWMAFELRNDSKIAYTPDYIRCTIRQKKRMKRMAVQEMPLEPVYERLPRVVAGDSTVPVIVGYRPFTLPGDHQLMLQVAERDGGRDLGLLVSSGLLLKAK